MAAKKALITGAEGFLGGHLFKRLESLGWEVCGTSRRPQKGLSTCDINDVPRLADIVSQTMPDVIFHIAALTPAAMPTATIEDYLRVNVSGTLNLLETARQFVPKARILLVTSSALYGQAQSDDEAIHEDSPLRPVNPYGISKATQHLIGYQYFVQHKMDVVRVCPFNLMGYGLPKGLVASDFAQQIVAIEHGKQEPIIHVGDLSAKRDFLDVQDAVDGLLSLVNGGQAGESYNLASAQAVPISDLLHDMIAMSSKVIEVQPRPNIVKNTVLIQIGTHDKLTAATGWKPQVPVKQSVSDVLAYWRTIQIEENV